jgi:hypothetical protein
MVLGSSAAGWIARGEMTREAAGVWVGFFLVYLAHPAMLELLARRKRSLSLMPSLLLGIVGAAVFVLASAPWADRPMLLLSGVLGVFFLFFPFAAARWGRLALPTHVAATIGLTAVAPLLVLAGGGGGGAGEIAAGPGGGSARDMLVDVFSGGAGGAARVTEALLLWLALYLFYTGGVLLVHARLSRERKTAPPAREALYLPTHVAGMIIAGMVLAGAWSEPGLGAALMINAIITAAASRRALALPAIGRLMVVQTVVFLACLAGL